MTNYENFLKMSIEEFAKTRVFWDSEVKRYRNDTTCTYIEEERQKAIDDEIAWLKQDESENL